MNKWMTGCFLSVALFSTNLLLAQEEVPAAADQGMWQTIVMIGIAMLFFYFILWRPEQKRRKALEDQRESLQKGDNVTAMGILGEVVRIKDHTVILKMFDGSKIEVLKGAITEVGPGHGSEKQPEKQPERQEQE